MCSFAVTVAPPPSLSVTKFLAFGDSMTEGVVSAPVTLALVQTPASYPARLEMMLVGRYPAQAPSVINAGVAGERAATTGVSRLPSVVNYYRPDVVLLMEGANDLNFWGAAGIDRAVGALAGMVDDARQRGARVFLATLPPQREGFPRGSGARLVPDFNRGVEAAAAAEGAVLVDVYKALAADINRYIGADGLHPTEAGYERIAETFLAVIRGTLETGAPQPQGMQQPWVGPSAWTVGGRPTSGR